jgi:hypothetical protein
LTNTTAIIGGLTSNKAFAGIAQFISEMVSNNPQQTSFTIVSASPPLLENEINEFLKSNSFPALTQMLLRSNPFQNVQTFKSQAIPTIQSTLPYVFLGDNVQSDPEVYSNYANQNPSRVLATYIHLVRDLNPRFGRGWITPYEVAYWEMKASRLSEAQVVSVGNEIAKTSDLQLIVPSFAVCPQNYDPLAGENLSPQVETTYQLVKNKVAAACSN